MSSDAMDDVSERHPSMVMDLTERHAMDVSERYNSPPSRSNQFNHQQHEEGISEHRPELEDNTMSNGSSESEPSSSAGSQAHLAHQNNNNRSMETTSRSDENPVQRAPLAAAAAPPPEEQNSLFDAPAPQRPRRPSFPSRRRNRERNPSLTSSGIRRPSMTEEEQAARRAAIKHIIANPSLSQIEKRRSIQSLMDGRKVGGRRSTIDSGMTNPYLAAKAKAELEKSGRNKGARRSTIDSGMTNPFMANATAEQKKKRRGTFDFERSNSQTSIATDADASVGGEIITSNTRHFAAAQAPSASLSASFHGGNGFHDSAASYSNNNSAHSHQSNLLHHSLHAQPSHSSQHPHDESDRSGRPYDESDRSGRSDDSYSFNSPTMISAFLQQKQPYQATTTKVPAVAAEASSSPPTPENNNRSISHEISRRAIEMAPTCTHYARNCHIVAPCCGATFGCRICHDDCPVLPPLLQQPLMPPPPPICPPVAAAAAAARAGGGGASSGESSDDECNHPPSPTNGRRKYQRVLRTSSMPTSFTQDSPPEHHQLDRFAIREIICSKCFTKQASKTNNCINCGVQFGEYHCAICNLWMSNAEKPYHCPDCGFCRVGGGENFRHCQDCGMCIDKSLFQDHNCKVGKYMSNCPVCQEDLFSSRDASHELPCGHAIHWHCFRELASHDSRCPVCKKTAETHERMKPTWDAMALSIAMQPVPPELAKVVTIKCNDCEILGENRSWHFLGVQCNHCESFNTVVEKITMMGQEAHDFISRREVQQIPPQLAAPAAAFAPAPAGGGEEPLEAETSSRPRPARRRRATVDSAVNPFSNRDNENGMP